MQQETSQEAATELKISNDMATQVRQFLLDIRELGARLPGDEVGAPGPERSLEDRASEASDSAQAFLNKSLGQLESGSRVLMGMSVALFAIGVGFLVLAGVRSVTDPDSVLATAVIGGIGVVQIVASFYRDPLHDIARTISNAQQAQIIVLSYMVGIGLVGKAVSGSETEGPQAALSRLTDEALQRLQQYTEHHPTDDDGEAEPSAGDG
jgi:hypothetical protein